MLLSVFEKYIFLQSLGWGIANSLWQAAVLWMLYKLIIIAGKNTSSLFRHHLSLLLLFSSFAWFAVTTVENYLLLNNSGNKIGIFNFLNISEGITNALQWLSVVYLLLLVAHCAHFVKRLQVLYKIRNSNFIKASADIRIFTEQTALHMGVRKKVSIWLSNKIDVPSVVGFLKPMILLPVTALNNLTTEQAEAVILHELAHIKRNDYLVNLLQSFIELILFFNPFAKLLGNVARKERENCCDDWVLNYQYDKHAYASALLTLEKNRCQQLKLALAATNGKKNLLGRIKRLFAAEPQVNINFIQQAKLIAATLLIMFGVFFVLPFTSKRTIPAEKQASNYAAATPLLTALELPVAVYKEIQTQPIANELPAPAKAIKEKITRQKIEQPEIPEEIEYSSALVNEELLNANKQLQEITIQAANKGLQIAEAIIVKIEEEKSGLEDKRTYLLELKNNNGNPEIKPLIILNQKVKALTDKIMSAAKTRLADSIKATHKKKITS